MDRERSHRYLQAMGVQSWRLRGGDALAELTAESAGEREAHAQVVVSPPADAVDAEREATRRSTGSAPTETVADMDWELLSRTVSACRACELCETRTQTVFGVGDRRADLMVIGEAPGADEDRQGKPFVGRAGQLLNLMLAAIGFARERVYIANILKCRPPGNRDPRPEEALRCEPFLMRQIALVRPRVLLSVGRISAQNLLKTDAPIGQLRGRWFELGPDRTPLTVTYHPAYLLRSPEQKAKVWQDLLQIVHRLREAAVDARDDISG
jgi:uracil-DNA glycosylase